MCKIDDPLKLSDLEFKVRTINNAGYATIVPYKDARVDMNRLDSTYGIGFWKRDHQLIDRIIFCTVSIWNKELKEWVSVQDGGSDLSYQQDSGKKEKGRISDAFKRSCTNLGIGRDLYDYPKIEVKLFSNEFEKKGNKTFATYQFKLHEWRWAREMKGKKVIYLAAKDQNGKVRFKFGAYTSAENLEYYPEKKEEPKPQIQKSK